MATTQQTGKRARTRQDAPGLEPRVFERLGVENPSGLAETSANGNLEIRADADFTRFLNNCRITLTRYAYSIARNGDDAKDAVQSAELRAWELWQDRRKQTEPIRWSEALLMTMTRNAAIDAVRKRRRVVDDPETALESLMSEAGEFDRAYSDLMVRQVLKRLDRDGKYRCQVVMACDTLTQAAAELKLSTEALRKWLLTLAYRLRVVPMDRRDTFRKRLALESANVREANRLGSTRYGSLDTLGLAESVEWLDTWGSERERLLVAVLEALEALRHDGPLVLG